MRFLVTGSAGHLGEAIVRSVQGTEHEAIGLDVLESPFTYTLGSVVDRAFVKECMSGIDAIIHTATLHKPHIGTHTRQDFVDTNITGTLNLLEEAYLAGIQRFVFTSTTSAFGAALAPQEGGPAVWITEDVRSLPKNIYGVTKIAAEDMCHLFHRLQGLPCIVLRTSRFFPEEDDSKAMREAFTDENAKANEFLYRRVDLEDVVDAHLRAVEYAPDIGFDRYLISATTPFLKDDLINLHENAPSVVREKCPSYEQEYQKRGWKMFESVDRVYVNDKARNELGWKPKYDFDQIVKQLTVGAPIGSELARTVGAKGYHIEAFEGGPYPVD